VRDDEQHAFGDALFLLGRCLFRLHESRAAIPVLRRHQQLFPGSRQTHLLLARALADTGDLPAARVELAAAKAPPSDNRRLEPREALARAQARVTVLRSGQTPTETGTGAA
ncbi:MAG: hypothetical protein KDC87_10865, partial [Planctomycetes bacterium]|nr:hypothetical protein [Planctomycetota bacterium]